MHKVGPSLNNYASSTRWAWMLVTRSFQTSANEHIGKWVKQNNRPCRSFRQNKLSPLLRRFMKTLGEPGDVLSDYAKHELRREAWVMRAADPTFPKNIVPTDHFLIPASLWGTLQFCVCVTSARPQDFLCQKFFTVCLLLSGVSKLHWQRQSTLRNLNIWTVKPR